MTVDFPVPVQAEVAADQTFVRYAQPEHVLTRLRGLPTSYVKRVMDDATCSALEARGGEIVDLILAMFGQGPYRRRVALKSELLSVVAVGSPFEDGFHIQQIVAALSHSALFMLGENPAHRGHIVSFLLNHKGEWTSDQVTEVLFGLSHNEWFKQAGAFEDDFPKIIKGLIKSALDPEVESRRLTAISVVLEVTGRIHVEDDFLEVIQRLRDLATSSTDRVLISLVAAAARGGLSQGVRQVLSSHPVAEVREAFYSGDSEMSVAEFGRWLKTDKEMFFNAALRNDAVFRPDMRKALKYLIEKTMRELTERSSAFMRRCEAAGISDPLEILEMEV